jgi:valine--pyruvate aminotransferase
MFRACPPKVELIGDHRFKYHIDFDRLVVDDGHAAICVSRPTNPSGNVLTDEEMSRLAALAEARHIPLLVDNAYGAPFPGILFRDVTPVWNDRMVMVMSLSKLGLPGTRTGIIIANEDLIESISATHAVAGLANGNIGQAITTPLLRDRSLFRLRDEAIRPFYQRKSNQAVAWLLEALDARLPFRIHVNEGALFLWVWFDDLPITAQQLYERLKARNVLIIPGHPFFYGLEEEHPHQHRCIRLSYAQSDAMVEQGIAILAEEVARAYAGR